MLNTQAPQSNSFLTGNFNISLNNDVNTQSLSVVESNNKETSPVIDTTTPQTNNTTTTHEQTKSKIELYMNALVHSTQCTSDSCTFAKCLQFKRVTRHNQSCKKFINDRCEFCRQLIAISVYHAKNCSNHTTCMVPFCMTIKQKLEINKSIEFITKYLKILCFKQQKSQSVHASCSDSSCETNHKRKFSCLDSEDRSVPVVSSSAIFEDSFDAKNLEMQKLKDAFFDKLKEVKEIKLNERNSCQITLNKLSREKLFSTIFQDQILANYPKLKTANPNYANLMVLLLRKEADLNTLSESLTSYLYLLTEMFYEVDKKLIKHKVLVSTESQTDMCDSEDKEMSCNKRIKIE